MDYRNNKIEYDKNTIIYAHGRMNNTMFGSLKKVITKEWLDIKENYVIKLSTEEENTLWQVFSVYKILTLSTCYNDSHKVVLHAKLIKREKK